MPATVPTRGVLKASTNRVRTSVALQGNAMWENVIGIVNEQAGTNTGVEALINAPTHGGGRKRSAAARAAAAEAVMATGGFDTAITSYESLLTLAKSQGAVGGSNRGACKVCGQLGHLTKQCRNQFSKYYEPEAEGAAAGGAGPSGAPALPAAGAAAGNGGDVSDLSDLSDSSSDSDSEAERKRRRKERKRKHKSKDRKHKSKKSRKESKKSSKHKKKKRQHSSSSDSGSSSDSD